MNFPSYYIYKLTPEDPLVMLKKEPIKHTI